MFVDALVAASALVDVEGRSRVKCAMRQKVKSELGG